MKDKEGDEVRSIEPSAATWGKSDQPIHQPIRTPDSWETSSQLETSNQRECEKCSLKKINQFILCLAIAFVEILSRMNCLIWPKIVILQLFSLVSSQMCSLKTTCQNRFKFPYDHCFHICNLYLMETGTQCFKEEDFMSHLFICQMSNGERAVAKCLQKLSWHPPCPLKSGRCCIMSCSLSSSWTLDYYLNNCRSARWKRGSRFGYVVIVIIFLSTSFTLLNLSDCLEIFLSGMHFLVIVHYKVKCKLFNHGHGKPSNLTYM